MKTGGGDGGDGVRVLGSGSALVSGIIAEGGPGGDGQPPGAPGVDYSGNVSFSSTPLPTSLMGGSSTIGGDLRVATGAGGLGEIERARRTDAEG
jgi:hypothetical protein